MIQRFVHSIPLLVLSALAGTSHAQDIFAPPSVRQQFWATRADEAISVDGRLQEPVWERAGVITQFVQREPLQGTPASYATQVRIVFDDDALYIGVVCHQPRAAIRVQNLQRDFSFAQNDVFGVAIDGFLDKRNALAFQTTPYGSQGDLEVMGTSEDGNLEWDARWRVRTTVSEDHWTAEIAIAWRTLRYPAGADRLGVVFARNIRSRNEQASAPAVPRVLSTYRMSYEGELRGIVVPPPGSSLQLRPYALVGTSRRGGSASSNAEVGGEAKWAVTPGTVLDFTWNTDFAQVDADRQVANLDRFDVFFPERRQFFLENAGIFNASVNEWLTPFFSRRIGLDARGQPIPLDGGLRLTHRSARDEVGILAMRQRPLDASPAAQFAVARYSRNLHERARLGGMLTHRRDESPGAGDARNSTYTLDGSWQHDESFGIQAMVSRSADQHAGDGLAGQLWSFYKNGAVRISLLEYYDRDYEPGVGLELLDANYHMHSLSASYDFRSPRLPAAIRSISPAVSAFVFEGSSDAGLLFAYAPIRPIRVEFQDGARADLHVEPNWQHLHEPFRPMGIDVAPGRYDYTRYRISAMTDPSAAFAASIEAETGGYLDGQLTTYSASARLAPRPYFELAADIEINEIRSLGVAAEDSTTSLYGINARVSVNPRVQLSALYQRDQASDRTSWNLRFSWEYQPLSFFYLVCNGNPRSQLDPAGRLDGSQVIAKLTYLFQL